jgi:predicted alpha/beta hydrolase family esterase
MERGRPRLQRRTPLRKEGRPPLRRLPWWQRVESHVASQVELYLSAIALGIALVVPFLLELGTDVQELAGAALVACVVQGLLHWLLRRRAAAVRRQLIGDIRGLLRDRINNHLQVVLFSLAGSGTAAASDEDRERLALAIAAVTAVSRTLEELSTDALRRWQHHYGAAVSGAASPGGSAADFGRGGWEEGR